MPPRRTTTMPMTAPSASASGCRGRCEDSRGSGSNALCLKEEERCVVGDDQSHRGWGVHFDVSPRCEAGARGGLKDDRGSFLIYSVNIPPVRAALVLCRMILK
jgi:hypothetical protein